MLSEQRLFWFEYDVLYCFNRFWLVEYCVFWNGDRCIMEMVELEKGLMGYVN